MYAVRPAVDRGCPISHRLASLLCIPLWLASAAVADPIPVRHIEGEVHAFLTIRDDAGKRLGYADEVNVREGRAWRSRLTIHFLDGSLADETAFYTQGESLHLLTDHLVQKGPSFPRPVDLTINTAKGLVTYHDAKDGRSEVTTEAMSMPADLANGIMPMVLQNLPHGRGEVKVSYIVMAPRPRMVRFAMHPEAQVNYTVGVGRPADHFRIHTEIGGVEGILAPVIGKEPPDMEAWVSSGDAPTFLKLHAFMFDGGPLWTLQLSSPVWQNKA